MGETFTKQQYRVGHPSTCSRVRKAEQGKPHGRPYSMHVREALQGRYSRMAYPVKGLAVEARLMNVLKFRVDVRGGLKPFPAVLLFI